MLSLIYLKSVDRGLEYGTKRMQEPDHRKKAPAQQPERRSEARSAADHEATIKLLNPLQASERISARVIETSPSGLTLRLKHALLPGTLVQIRVGEKMLFGEIRYCNPSGAGFRAGVRLQDVFDTGA